MGEGEACGGWGVKDGWTRFGHVALRRDGCALCVYAADATDIDREQTMTAIFAIGCHLRVLARHTDGLTITANSDQIRLTVGGRL